LTDKSKDVEVEIIDSEKDINNENETTENRDEKDLEIESLQQKLKESEDKYIRVFSEFENYKKRLEREKYQAIEYSSEKFAKELLPVLDNLQMAIQSAETNPNLQKLKEGIDLTLKNFLLTLEKNGIEKIGTENGFDPNFHEAVMRVENDEVESGEIVQILQNGYKLKDRVLRATMVSIAN
jgi:molecular chaperone GrpE